MVKKTIIILVIFLLALILFKDYALKFFLKCYIEKELSGTVTIKKLSLGIHGLHIEDVNFSSQPLSWAFRQLYLSFDLIPIRQPKVSSVHLRDASFTLNKLPNKLPLVMPGSTQEQDIRLKLPYLNLENISITVNKLYDIDGSINFSFKGLLSPEGIYTLDSLSIKDGSICINDLYIKHFNLKQVNGRLYQLAISKVKIKEKEIAELLFPLLIEESSIIFKKMAHEIFGPEGTVEGTISYDGEHILISVQAENISLERVIRFISDNTSVMLAGQFSGIFTVTLEGLKILNIAGDLKNFKGGFINLKDEAAFDFLRKYLDERSYITLVDSLKNYQYNEGVIVMNKSSNDLLLELHFDSHGMGRRDIAVNLHDIFGGGR